MKKNRNNVIIQILFVFFVSIYLISCQNIEVKDYKKNSEEILKADLVIEALGFEPEDLPVMFNEPALNVTQWGTLKVDFKNLMTSLEGVFAAGDIIRGASLVVWGIKDGRDAAGHIHNYLTKNMQEGKRVVNE